MDVTTLDYPDNIVKEMIATTPPEVSEKTSPPILFIERSARSRK
jgi:hypothetical protein